MCMMKSPKRMPMPKNSVGWSRLVVSTTLTHRLFYEWKWNSTFLGEKFEAIRIAKNASHFGGPFDGTTKFWAKIIKLNLLFSQKFWRKNEPDLPDLFPHPESGIFLRGSRTPVWRCPKAGSGFFLISVSKHYWAIFVCRRNIMGIYNFSNKKWQIIF